MRPGAGHVSPCTGLKRLSSSVTRRFSSTPLSSQVKYGMVMPLDAPQPSFPILSPDILGTFTDVVDSGEPLVREHKVASLLEDLK